MIFLQGFFVTHTNEVQKQEYMLFPGTVCKLLAKDIYFNAGLCLSACMSHTRYYYAHFLNKHSTQSDKFCSYFQC